jgi:signal transduction histidine kinase/GGDEF domain-containing protein
VRQGAQDYLVKPLKPAEMIVRLRKALEEKERLLQVKMFAHQLEKTNRELRKIDQIKSEFVSVASHELRTPLATIKNAIELILKGKTGGISEVQVKFLSLAERNINRLTGILNNLLDLSRIESGKMAFKFEPLALKETIEFVLSSFIPQAEAKSIRLSLESPEDLPPLRGDREKVEQILTNLIGNAIKFTPEGGTVSVSARSFDREGRATVVSVTDSGVGISNDQIQRVFEKFHQVQDSLHRSTGGTGLGLAITKGLVEAHHGKIWAESEVGKGSTFTFTLPTLKGEKEGHHFRTILTREFERAARSQSPLALILVTVADPKVKTSDPLFDRLESKVKESLYRRLDTVTRWEKGKLLAILCEADAKGAEVICRRLREGIEKTVLGGDIPFSALSFGTAAYPEEALSKRDLFRKAKEGMKMR